MNVFITSGIDYCNTVLAGAPKYVTNKLQRVLNAAARLVSNTKKFDRSLSRLLHTDLHWLDVAERVQFKLCMTVHRCMQDIAPQYLKEYCILFLDSDSQQRLRSASRHLLSVPRRRGTFGCRVFAVAGTTAWNCLPNDLCNLSRCDSYFGRFLKSILFSFHYSMSSSGLVLSTVQLCLVAVDRHYGSEMRLSWPVIMYACLASPSRRISAL